MRPKKVARSERKRERDIVVVYDKSGVVGEKEKCET